MILIYYDIQFEWIRSMHPMLNCTLSIVLVNSS